MIVRGEGGIGFAAETMIHGLTRQRDDEVCCKLGTGGMSCAVETCLRTMMQSRCETARVKAGAVL